MIIYLQLIVLSVVIGLFIGTLYINAQKCMEKIKVKLNINGVIKASWMKKNSNKEEYYTLDGTQIDLDTNIVSVVEECTKSNVGNDIPKL